MTKTVSLVLGAGAARGLAHIGVIRVLEQQGYQINAIAGCSMGALIGGLYAAGGLDEFTRLSYSFKRIDFLKYLDLSFFAEPGVLKGDLIINTLRDIVGEINIEDLPMPFIAVATDLYASKEVWLERGSLFDAIRASISIPGIFTPYSIGHKLLVDGAILNPVPVLPLLGKDSDFTIAVDVNGEEADTSRTEVHTPYSQEAPEYRKKIDDFLISLQARFKFDSSKEDEKLSLTDILLMSYETMQETITRYKLAANKPDILISIPRNICEVHEFYHAREVIEAGERWTRRALESVRS